MKATAAEANAASWDKPVTRDHAPERQVSVEADVRGCAAVVHAMSNPGRVPTGSFERKKTAKLLLVGRYRGNLNI